MPRLQQITVDGWTVEGPAFTVSKPAAGWSNRHARRRGELDEAYYGEHALLGTERELDDEAPAAAMLLDGRAGEVWAFKAGHVYRVELLLDGEALAVGFDAREEDRIETLAEGLDLLSWEALEDEDLADWHGFEGRVRQPSNISDPSESQDPHPGGALSVNDDLEAPAYEGAIAPEDLDAAADELTAEPETEADPLPAQEETPAPTPAPDLPTQFDGLVDEFLELADALTDAELVALGGDTRKGVREHAAHLLKQRAEADPED